MVREECEIFLSCKITQNWRARGDGVPLLHLNSVWKISHFLLMSV